MGFQKATRKGSKLVISLGGLSGSGKTYSAIQIASGLASSHDKIAFIDTENGRGALYADIISPSFDIDDIYAPFTADAYIQKINAAAKAGYEVVIIDSASHEWDGLGGVLEQAQKAAGNAPQIAFRHWGKPKSQHNRFVNELLQCNAHIIVCLRAKNKFKQEGKDIIDAGLTVIQHENFIYEMTISMMMDEETKTPKLTKCPDELKDLFPVGKYITPECGKRLLAWVNTGEIVDSEVEALKALCHESAIGGLKALQTTWEGLTKEQRKKVQHIKEQCKEIASRVPEPEPSIEPSDAQKFEVLHPLDGIRWFGALEDAGQFLLNLINELREDDDSGAIKHVIDTNEPVIGVLALKTPTLYAQIIEA